MYRFMLTLLALSTTLGMSVSAVYAGSSLRDDLTERFRLSRIEVQNPSYEGAIIKKGTVLRLQADGIPANTLRSVQLTVAPVRLPDGKAAYGCTEFVFAFDPGSLDRADLDTIAGRICQVLTRNANG